MKLRDEQLPILSEHVMETIRRPEVISTRFLFEALRLCSEALLDNDLYCKHLLEGSDGKALI